MWLVHQRHGQYTIDEKNIQGTRLCDIIWDLWNIYNIPKTYHISGEKALDTILHMIAHINIFPIFDTIQNLTMLHY